MTSPANHRGLFIGGEWISTDQRYPVHNPATGARIDEAALGGRPHLEQAVEVARSTFRVTRAQPSFERVDLLQRIVAELTRRRAEFVASIVAEAGKPIVMAEAEVARALLTFSIAAEEARRGDGEHLNVDGVPAGKGSIGLVRRFPIGVIYALTPFNFPLNLVAHKVAPCLATGNTMVLKPAPKTPLTAFLLAEVLQSAGMPAGQVNVVTCSNEDAGHLVGDARVAMTSFTGSPGVGWRLKELCGRQKIALELGGNAPVIVHEDAELDRAIPAITSGGFSYAGQSCISVQRILVHRPIYEAFRERLVIYTQEHAVVGDPSDRRTMVGPMIDNLSLERVLSWIRIATASGAKLLLGGTADGLFLAPTILENITQRMEVCSKEVFAPLVTLQSYETFDDALRIANDTEFGLQAGVFTQDLRRAHQAFDVLDVGGVLINHVPTYRVEQMPYGGVKMSGFGREGLRYAMQEMTEPKSWIMNVT